jgi:hypothetical protein
MPDRPLLGLHRFFRRGAYHFGMLITVDSQTATRLLRIYGITPPITEDRTSSHQDADPGIPITIDGVADDELGRSIRLKVAGRRASRVCPLTEADAQALLADLQAENVLPVDPRSDRTVAQLLMKCSKLYQDSGVSELHLVLYLTAQGYRTHAVYMQRTRNVSIRGRLAPSVRDQISNRT